MKLWGGRFQKETDELVNAFNASIQVDSRMYREDIQGSMAHAAMLADRGIISREDNEQIQAGLQSILEDAEAGRVAFTEDNEDIHMNVETLLTARIGDAGKRLHTGRSRNDQVAVDLRLNLRREIREIQEDVLDLMEAVLDQTRRRWCRDTPTSSGPSPSPLPTICWPTPPCCGGTMAGWRTAGSG